MVDRWLSKPLYTQTDDSSELFVPSAGEFGVPRQVRANYTTSIDDSSNALQQYKFLSIIMYTKEAFSRSKEVTMRTASVSETRQQLSTFLRLVKGDGEDVLIQSRGKAEAVIIPFEDYKLLQDAREKRRRRQAIEELKQIALEVGARNEAMSRNDAEEIADQITKEAVRNLIDQGKVTFQE